MLALLSLLGLLGSVAIYDQVTDDDDDNDNEPRRVGPEPFEGSDGGDLLDLGDGGFAVDAGAGDDIVSTGAGNDVVNGGEGRDLIETTRGSDTINAQQDDDLVNAGAGDDRVDLGFGDDAYLGGVATGADIDLEDLFNDDPADAVFVSTSGVGFALQTDAQPTDADAAQVDVDLPAISDNVPDDDVVDGNRGDDTLIDIKGSDILNGGRGDDLIASIDAGQASAENSDRLDGGLGADTLYTDAGDIARGGAGADSFNLLSRSADDDLQVIEDFDPAEDALTLLVQHGNPEAMEVTIEAAGAEDTHVLLNGSVVALLQGVPVDTLDADLIVAVHALGGPDPMPDPGPEPVQVDGTDGDDAITLGDEGYDVAAGGGNDTVATGDGHDIVAGGEGADVIETSRGNDVINANQQDDKVNAGPGDDRVTLGWGDDAYLGGISDGADLDLDMIFNDDPNNEVFAKMKGLQGQFLTDAPSSLPNPDQVDVFLPGISDNVTDNDTVNGNQGNDTLIDIRGRDSLHGDAGDDRIVALDTRGASLENSDFVDGGDGDDVLLTDAGDTVTGGAGADLFGSFSRVSGEDVQVITDFDPDEDAVTVLVEHGAPEDLELTLVATNAGADTAIEINGALHAILQGVSPDQLSDADILAAHVDG